jgi:hypothetical protein
MKEDFSQRLNCEKKKCRNAPSIPPSPHPFLNYSAQRSARTVFRLNLNPDFSGTVYLSKKIAHLCMGPIICINPLNAAVIISAIKNTLNVKLWLSVFSLFIEPTSKFNGI